MMTWGQKIDAFSLGMPKDLCSADSMDSEHLVVDPRAHLRRKSREALSGSLCFDA
jgi:hypothetical protein